jgi:hypothetical protein
MCCEDVSIGKDAKSATVEKPIGVTTTLICGQSPKRIFLAISPPAVGVMFCGPKSDLTPGVGFQVNANTDGLFMSVSSHGDMIREAWYGSVPGGASTILVVEGIGTGICDDKPNQ